MKFSMAMDISFLGESPYMMSALGFGLCTGTMILSWAWAMSNSYFSVVDAVWAFGIGILGILYFFVSGHQSVENVTAVGLLLLWSTRLGWHLTRRLFRQFPKEDRRYEELRKSWHRQMGVKSLVFFIFQSFTQSFFALPIAFLLTAPRGQIAPWFWVGAVVSIVGLFGESTADAQLKQFVAEHSSDGKVCNRGLWNYSRHPNYFFEWIIWCGFGVMGASAPNGFISILCPLAMLILLLFVTGVPPAEASSLRSKGDRYRRYQSVTSKFIPWFPKENSCSPKNFSTKG